MEHRYSENEASAITCVMGIIVIWFLIVGYYIIHAFVEKFQLWHMGIGISLILCIILFIEVKQARRKVTTKKEVSYCN